MSSDIQAIKNHYHLSNVFDPYYTEHKSYGVQTGNGCKCQNGDGVLKSIKKGINGLRNSKVISKTLNTVSGVAGFAGDLGVPGADIVRKYANVGAKVSGQAGFGSSCKAPRKRVGKTLKDGETKRCEIPCKKLKKPQNSKRTECRKWKK